jgi:hypothetical protein
MDKRQEYVAEINAACEELKTAGIPHAVDLAKHIVRMTRDLNFYDKCMRMGGKGHSSKQSRSEFGRMGNKLE